MGTRIELSERLRGMGHPATRVRREILRLLGESRLPVTPRELLGRFPSPKPDLSTVYRNLGLLVSLGLVRSVALHERSRRYEPVTEGAHRHRTVCRRCGRIDSYEPPRCDLTRIEEDIRESLGFRVTDHSLEFFGACRECDGRGPTR